MNKMWYYKSLLLIYIGATLVNSQFLECHDDILYEPEEGILNDIEFTWLGLLQYIHVKKGNPHYFRVPRVILVSRQFVISTAVDATQVPEGYALGNVVFGEYERDERECGISSNDMMKDGACNPAVMIVPVLDVLIHPEYKYFGSTNSIALLKLIKPMRSAYMLPVCLPTSDYEMRIERPFKAPLWHIDFASDAPREFYGEEKEVTQLFVLPMELCFFNQTTGDNSSMIDKRKICTSDCDFHSGAPTVVHEHTGHWALISISEGSGPCPDPYKTRVDSPPPPRHILLQPYVSWITNAIIGGGHVDIPRHVQNAENDPFGYAIAREGTQDTGTELNPRGWVGRWWLAGIRCFDRGNSAKEIYRFYHESFIITTEKTTDFTYFLQIDSISTSKIVCLKVGTPYPIGQPKCWDLNTAVVYLRIPVRGFTEQLRFFVEAWAVKVVKEKEGDETGSSDSKISTSEEQWP